VIKQTRPSKDIITEVYADLQKEMQDVIDREIIKNIMEKYKNENSK
jgi:hypothetical protein